MGQPGARGRPLTALGCGLCLPSARWVTIDMILLSEINWQTSRQEAVSKAVKRRKDGKQWNGPSRKVLQRQLCGSEPLTALLPTWAGGGGGGGGEDEREIQFSYPESIQRSDYRGLDCLVSPG